MLGLFHLRKTNFYSFESYKNDSFSVTAFNDATLILIIIHLLDCINRQDNEMAAAVKDLHIKMTEKDINDLAAKHFEEHSLAAGRLNSEVEALHQSQRKEYRTWLMTVLEQQAVCPSPL